MKIKTSSKEITATLNAILKDVQDMSFKDLVELLQHEGIPYGRYLVPMLIENEQLKRVRKGVYTFCGTKPLYYKVVDTFLEQLRTNHNKHNKDYRDRKDSLEESECIKFLKARGYKVFKPVTELKEM